MMQWLVALFLIAVMIGHGAVFVWLFNRLNACGVARYIIKRWEKVLLGTFALLPIILLLMDGWTAWNALTTGFEQLNQLTWFAKAYAAFCIAALVALLPLWIIGRIEYWSQAKYRNQIKTETIDMLQQFGDELFKPRWLKKCGRWPGNEVHLLQINRKELLIEALPGAWNDVKVAHLSDLHLTLWYDMAYFERAVDEIMALKPDLFVISGDLIDYDRCIQPVVKLLSKVDCTLGQHFVLGNHDRRISDQYTLRKPLQNIGWHDLGQSCYESRSDARTLQIFGNERPWFEHQDRNISERDLLVQPRPNNSLRIAVSHSPDQWRWARNLQANLILCGHTHGGQVRLPIIGPIISPSYDGARYAGGIYNRGSMKMHVSRGLAGTQPLRFRCVPEATILKLQVAK